MWKFVFLSLFVSTTLGSHQRYDNFQVWRIRCEDETDVKWVKTAASMYEDKIDSFAANHQTNSVDLMVSPWFIDTFRNLLTNRGLQFTVIIENVQELIDNERDTIRTRAVGADFDYTVYHTYDEIQDWVKTFSQDNSNIVESFLLTTSYEKRPINGLKISGDLPSTGKPAIYFQGGIHSREWISPATVMYFTNKFVEDYGRDSEVTRMLDEIDWYIVPSLNADGYVYTWEYDRLWRKTRQRFKGNLCVGTDPNRNYDYKWGGEGASNNSCSLTYAGPHAFSEPEIKGSTGFLLEKAKTQPFKVFIDWHSYSQLMLAPWSWTDKELPPDAAAQDDFARETTQAIESVYGTKYVYGPGSKVLYVSSGASKDWGYVGLGATYSYTVELRDTGTYGFLLPEQQIRSSGIETYEGVKAMGRFILNEINN
ncbi:carboxypeptidase B-like [Antedon mediterranea]|uniref:carboxypeptidase B-like n=1 Tax=Antedon mediterranea TaxID=105859 RepID=UPI003AF7E83D